jgi:hypothetical protein
MPAEARTASPFEKRTEKPEATGGGGCVNAQGRSPIPSARRKECQGWGGEAEGEEHPPAAGILPKNSILPPLG